MNKRKFKYEKYKYNFEEKEHLFYWSDSKGQIVETKYDLLFKKYDYYNKSKITKDSFNYYTTAIRFTDLIDNTK